MDAKLRLTAVHTCSIGTLTASIVHPREVFKVACVGNASGIIVLHNHPSGDPLPSEEDRRITSRFEEVGQLMGIPLLDHVIIGRSGGCYDVLLQVASTHMHQMASQYRHKCYHTAIGRSGISVARTVG